MDDKRSVRKQMRRESNRRAILEAAESVFAEKGFGPATMDDIASEAQFSKATLYRYFEGKSEVFSEIVLNSFISARDRFAEIRGGGDGPVAKLKEMIRTNFAYFREKRSIARILWSEKSVMKKLFKCDVDEHPMSSHGHDFIPEEYLRIMRDILNNMCAVIQEGIDSGDFRSVDPEEACMVLGAMMRGMQLQGPVQFKEYSDKESSELLMRYFLDGIRDPKQNNSQ